MVGNVRPCSTLIRGERGLRAVSGPQAHLLSTRASRAVNVQEHFAGAGARGQHDRHLTDQPFDSGTIAGVT